MCLSRVYLSSRLGINLFEMQKVSIFFAGSTALCEERNQIKALANDLNAKYERKGVQVVVYTYEYLGENQDTYNHFIAKEADAAIFVLKERINEYTLEELRKAIEARKNHGHPHILVFLHAVDDNLESNKTIRDTIKQHLGRQHYIDYKNSEDLKTKTRERLVPIAEEHLRRGLLIKALCTVVVLLTLVVLGIFSYLRYSNSELLLLAGGGSVANYIEDYKHINLDKRDNTTCLRMGSKLAWPLLAEEGLNLSKSENKHMKCVPVVMSAGKADINDLIKICDPIELRKTLFIMEYFIGNDTLAIFLDNKWFGEIENTLSAAEHCISVEELGSLLRGGQNSVDIFSTSPESGTRIVYKRLLGEYGYSVTSEAVETFHENIVPTYKFPDGKHIFLGSTSFYPRQVRGSLKKLTVTDSDNNVCTKDLYLYFPAYHVPGDVPQKCTIPRCVMNLLEDIGVSHSGKKGFGAFKYEVDDANSLIQEYKPS